MEVLSVLGPALIIIAWLLQFYLISQHKKDLNIIFVTAYSLGVLMILINAFRLNDSTTGILNAVILIIAFMTLLQLRKPRV